MDRRRPAVYIYFTGTVGALLPGRRAYGDEGRLAYCDGGPDQARSGQHHRQCGGNGDQLHPGIGGQGAHPDPATRPQPRR